LDLLTRLSTGTSTKFLTLQVLKPKVNVEAETKILEKADRIVEAAFKFWFEYSQRLDAGGSTSALRLEPMG
jgi:hypothetical protein